LKKLTVKLFIDNEEYRLRLRLESLFEPPGSGSEVFEPRLIRLRLGCWSLGSGSRLRLLSLKNSHEILH
jgi:hypothetical protein